MCNGTGGKALAERRERFLSCYNWLAPAFRAALVIAARFGWQLLPAAAATRSESTFLIFRRSLRSQAAKVTGSISLSIPRFPE